MNAEGNLSEEKEDHLKHTLAEGKAFDKQIKDQSEHDAIMQISRNKLRGMLSQDKHWMHNYLGKLDDNHKVFIKNI